MAWLGELLSWAGPWAGWMFSGLLGTTMLWFYATDRLISKGRHDEQATHYEQLLKSKEESHHIAMEELRSHFKEMLEVAHQRAESFRDDRDYWREVGLDLMATVAATMGHQEPGS